MKKDSVSSKKPKPPLGGPVGVIGKPSSSKKPKLPLEVSVGGKGKKPSLSKKPKLPLEGSIGGKGKKPSVKRKKMGSEIDEIFATRKRTNPEEDNDKPSRTSSVTEKLSNRRTVVRGSSSTTRVVRRDFFQDSGPSQRKKTADGLNVYTEEELGFGKSEAGGTRQCPFDCDCCF